MDQDQTAAGGVERRGKPRINEPFPAEVRGVDASGELFQAETVLDNLSASGLYLRLARRVERDTEVSIVTRLSSVPTEGALVAMRGVVVRTEPQVDGSYGMAVVLEQHLFL